MPESSEMMKRQKYYSSDSSYGSSSSSSESEDNGKEEYQNKKREKQVTYNLKQSNHYKLIQQSSKLISSNVVVMWRITELKLSNSIKRPWAKWTLVCEETWIPSHFLLQLDPPLGLDPPIPFRVCKQKTNEFN